MVEKPREDGAELEWRSPAKEPPQFWLLEPGEGPEQCSWAAAGGASPADAGISDCRPLNVRGWVLLAPRSW